MIENHLWQSTVFALGAWLLTLALARNSAALRYRIWLAASLKFLIPFVALAAIGTGVQWTQAPARVQLPAVVQQVAQPFPESQMSFRRSTQRDDTPALPILVWSLWALGASASAALWTRDWLLARRIVKSAVPCGRAGSVPVLRSAAGIEPGLFGILRPVLILPAGIEDQIPPAQIQAIVAHELAHVRRRDNLTSLLHMLVETIFWFHPAVWLIRARLAEERERACDQAVLAGSVEPEVYAEGILNVCRFQVESRLACVSGVTGGDLKRRIDGILFTRATHLNFGKRALIAAAIGTAAMGPLVLGIARAQSAVSFEVASLKPNAEKRDGWFFNFDPGRFRATHISLAQLISLAYDLPINSNRIIGGPAWARSETFDVEGKADLPGLSGKAREIQMKRMLQSLLADRFQLVVRRESKELPIYALTVAKGGPKLTKAKIEEKDCPEGRVDASSCHVINGGMGRGLHAAAADIEDVALFAGNWTDRPLIDKTGLKGLYQLDTEGWTPLLPRPPRPDGQPNSEDLALADPTRRTLFMIFEQLGLKMEPQKGPVDMFVIERAERPSAN